MIRLLFVCMGNICRSPTAEGVFRKLLAERGISGISVDSAGTLGYHAGQPPDGRAIEAAARRGIDLSDQASRQVRAEDFAIFDHILAMDRGNLVELERLCPREFGPKLHLFLTHAPELGVDEVPDPYYGRGDGFDYVLDLIEAASRALLENILSGPPKTKDPKTKGPKTGNIT